MFERLQRWILQVDYSEKIKIGIGIAILAATILAIFIYNSHTSLLKWLEFQKAELIESRAQKQASSSNPIHLQNLVFKINFDTTNEQLFKLYTDLVPKLKQEIEEFSLSSSHKLSMRMMLSQIQQFTKFLQSPSSPFIYGSKAPIDLPILTLLTSIDPFYQNQSIMSLKNLKHTALDQTNLFEDHVFTILLNRLEEQIERLRLHILVTFLLYIIGIMVVLAIYYTRLFRRPLVYLEKGAEQLASGDLNACVPIMTKDEVKQISESFNQLAAFLKKRLNAAFQISQEVKNSAEQIATIGSEFETAIFKQEREYTLIEKHSQGVLKTVQTFSLQLEELNHTIFTTAQLAIKSQNRIDEMDRLIEMMNTASEKIIKTLTFLHDKFENIYQIINTIIKITDQINLLALNISIRSGKKENLYRGFSVISEKIQEIADETANATLEMEQIVQQILQRMRSTMTNIRAFSQSIQKQVTSGNDIKALLQEMMIYTQQQQQKFEGINTNMHGQSQLSKNMYEDLKQLKDNSRRNSDSMKQLLIETKNIIDQSEHLNTTLKQFTTPQASPIASPNLPSNI